MRITSTLRRKALFVVLFCLAFFIQLFSTAQEEEIVPYLDPEIINEGSKEDTAKEGDNPFEEGINKDSTKSDPSPTPTTTPSDTDYLGWCQARKKTGLEVSDAAKAHAQKCCPKIWDQVIAKHTDTKTPIVIFSTLDDKGIPCGLAKTNSECIPSITIKTCDPTCGDICLTLAHELQHVLNTDNKCYPNNWNLDLCIGAKEHLDIVVLELDAGQLINPECDGEDKKITKEALKVSEIYKAVYCLEYRKHCDKNGRDKGHDEFCKDYL